MLDALQTLIDAGMTDKTLDTVIEELISQTDGEDKLCLIALSWSRGEGYFTNPDDITYTNKDCVNISGAEYLILDDDDMATAWDASLESYGEEYVEGYKGQYFDREKWKEDAKHAGVGHSLSPYDSEPHEYKDYSFFRIS